MPLHDWRDERSWDSLRLLWLNQLLEWLQTHLPSAYRVYIGGVPPGYIIHIDVRGQTIAVADLVSSESKGWPSIRNRCTVRYLSYLRRGMHLLLVDVLPQPVDFSFADSIACNLEIEHEATPSPFAMSYRVGEPLHERGVVVDLWRRPLQVGQPLPVLPLALNDRDQIDIDLEATYRQAAIRAYLE